MDLFHQLQDESITTLQKTMTEQHERLIRNAEEVKADIQKSFGCYFGWLREREAVLMRAVDRAVELHLSRWQSSVCEAMVSLKILRESVELLDDPDGGESGTPNDVKDQIERLLRDMSSAMEDDLRSDHVVKFEETGKIMLRNAIENCGEVSTQHKTSAIHLRSPQSVSSSSKWSNWLQSGTNLEHLEEPEIPYDFDDLGSMMSIAKMVKTDPLTAKKLPNLKGSAVQPQPVLPLVTNVSANNSTAVVPKMEENVDHFAYLMSTPMEQWLKPAPVLLAQPQVQPQNQQPLQKPQILTLNLKKQSVCQSGCVGCTYASHNLEIENLDRLQCITHAPVAKDLQTWLMQPDVVPLPAVKEVCRGDRQCSSLNECLGTNHCLNYFYSLSKCTEDWLSTKSISPSMTSATIKCGNSRQESLNNDNDSICSKSSYKFSSSGEEFEVLSSPSPANTHSVTRVAPVVSEDLKVWLKNSAVNDCFECSLTDCCQKTGGAVLPVVSKGVQEWLLKTY